MPRAGAPALAKLTIERIGLSLELKLGNHKGRRRLRIYARDDSGERNPWLSHDTDERVADLLEKLPDVLESDITDEFKTAMLTADVDGCVVSTADSPAVQNPPVHDSIVQAGLFADVDDTMAEFDAAAGVDLGAPMRTRGAENHASVRRFQPESSLTEGQLNRLSSRGTVQRRALSTGCPRPDCVQTRREYAELQSKYKQDTDRRALPRVSKLLPTSL